MRQATATVTTAPASEPKPHRRGPKPTTGPGYFLGVRAHEPTLKVLDEWIAAQGDADATRPQAARQIIEDYGALQSDHAALREALAQMRATEQLLKATQAEYDNSGTPLFLTTETMLALASWLAAHPEFSNGNEAILHFVQPKDEVDRASATKESESRGKSLRNGALHDIVTVSRMIVSWRCLIFERLHTMGDSCDFEASEGMVETAKHAEALLWDAFQDLGAHLTP